MSHTLPLFWTIYFQIASLLYDLPIKFLFPIYRTSSPTIFPCADMVMTLTGTCLPL